MKQLRVGIVADDLTGAEAIGRLFARHGWATRLFMPDAELAALPKQLASARADVVILNTDARFDAPEAAVAKVRRATSALDHWGAQVFYPCASAPDRGPMGTYFDAMLAELGHDFGIAVAAIPRDGQVTTEGRTERLPIEVVRAEPGVLIRRIDDARKQGVRYLLADIEHQQDLAALGEAVLGEPVLLGARDVLEAAVRDWPTPPPFDPFGAARPTRKGGVLVLAGSDNPHTRAQEQALEAAGCYTVTLTEEVHQHGVGPLMTSVAYRLQQGRNVLVRAAAWPAASQDVQRLCAKLAAFTETACGRLVVLGGRLSDVVYAHMRIPDMLVLDDTAEGLPVMFAVRPQPLLLVLQCGGYGAADFGLRAVEHLAELCHDRWA